MNIELHEKIIADLEKSGFSTELRARQALIKSGWSTTTGYGYLDKDENKSREIDIIATKSETRTSRGKIYLHCEFHICAEVKKSEKPWVVFDQETHPLLRSCAWNNLISAINLPEKPQKFSNSLSQNSLIKINGRVGGGIHESFKNPDQPSRWYSSFTSVAKASEFYLDTVSPDGEKQSSDIIKNPCELHFVQPLIILNSPLYKASLSNSGDIELVKIESAAFRFQYQSKNYKNSNFRIDLTTLNNLDTYLENIKIRQANLCTSIEKSFKKQSNIDAT